MSTQARVAHRQENFFERSAWVLFLVIGLLEILFGMGDMIKGVENDPAILVSATGRTPAELKAEDPLLYNASDQQQKVSGWHCPTGSTCHEMWNEKEQGNWSCERRIMMVPTSHHTQQYRSARHEWSKEQS